ncbi:trigger factor [Methylohalomonas lacus]|uniref:Trigger factor n=1 Tax=Methylohalomonas lacus TaxID=398773 RepID=A0AAE3L3Y5_9GAMM|nr:trigger factor [Methylohalomonas lacus]MCS3902993.1 trigger factor [Methylohalomonas lacus]
MQVSVEELGSLERRLRVEIPEDRIAGEVENRLKNLSRTTRIDGFRPGKVPLKLVQKRYGQQVRAEVIGETMRQTFYEAVTEKQLNPAGQPKIEPQETEQGFTYTATFEVYPEVKPVAPDQLKVEQPVCEVNETDVDQMIETLRQQQKQLEAVERAAAEGDTVKVDFTGRVDGEVFEGGQGTDFDVEIGANRLIPGFEEGLVGAQAGDTRNLSLKFPDDYGKAELAGKPVEFEITVKQVQEARLPELNDEFFQAFGVTEGGMEAFRAEVRRNMEREAEQTVRNRTKESVMDALYQANSVELPAALVEAEQDRLLEQTKNNMRQYGIGDEQLEAMGMDKSNYLEQAQKRVALQLLVREMVSEQGIKAETSEMRELIEKNASGYESPEEVVNWYFADQQRLGEVEALVIEDKLIDWLLSQAQVSETPYTFDALMNKGQTE